MHALSGPEVERLLAAAPPEYRAMFMTAVSTGVRLGELRASLGRRGARPGRASPTGAPVGDGVRGVPAAEDEKLEADPDRATPRAALREHRMRRRFKDDEDLLFPNAVGRALAAAIW